MVQVNVDFPQEEVEIIDRLAEYFVSIGMIDKPTRTNVIRAGFRTLLDITLQAIEAERLKMVR